MRSKLRLLVASACATATIAAIAIAPAQAESTTGTITGQLTDAGEPAAGFVTAYDTNQQSAGSAGTDGFGRYTITDLPAGDYKLQFFVSTGSSLFQWAHQKMSFDEADTFTVTAGATTVVDEAVVPTGSIGGTLSNASGPVAGIRVSAQPLGPQPSFGHGIADSQGRFEMTSLLPGNYRIEFHLASCCGQQYHPQQLDPNKAAPVSVVVGQRTEIAETLLPTGSAAGRLVEDGVGIAGAQVIWSQLNDFQSLHTTTDGDGRYAIETAFTGTYRVSFELPDGRSQLAHGKLDPVTADVFTIAADAQTVVDETVLPTGQASVRAVDAKTGSPITGFCAEIRGMFVCTDGDVAGFAKVPVGRHTVTVFTDGDNYLSGATAQIEVTSGATTEATVRVIPSAIITTIVRDRQTGAPVAGVCLFTLRLRLAAFPDGTESCSGEEGRVRIARLAAGTYTLFAEVHDGVHGMQWVGWSGGTGNQFTARPVTVQAGQTVTLPAIQLDRAGTISGRVTDKATDAPLPDARVSLLTGHPGSMPLR